MHSEENEKKTKELMAYAEEIIKKAQNKDDGDGCDGVPDISSLKRPCDQDHTDIKPEEHPKTDADSTKNNNEKIEAVVKQDQQYRHHKRFVIDSPTKSKGGGYQPQ